MEKKSSAQAIIEFVITIPLLLLMLVFIFDLGRATFYYSSITNSAREGARYGIINPDDENGIIQRVLDFSFGIDPADLDVQVSKNDDENSVTVVVSFEFVPATPLLGPFLGGSDGITFQTQTIMEIEG
ncbi:MAG: pilus assembly protein [Chloroflexi bacterium]|nr:pilus assembly protein [Chloroflexota bacterium]